MARARALARLAAPAAIAWLAAEAALRAVDLETRLLSPLLNYQSVDLEVHRPADGPLLLYELNPGASAVFEACAGGRGERRVTVNSLGFRGRERPRAKRPGVKRLVCIGSSNTYGACAGDGGTYPEQLERVLERRWPGRYEVWNAGLSAASLEQDLERAERILREYDPDLLLFQIYNVAPRLHFLQGRPVAPAFQRHPELYLRFLKLPPLPDALQTGLLAHSRVYRLTAIALTHLAGRPNARGGGYETLERFAAAHRGLPIVLFAPVPPPGQIPAIPGARVLRLYERLPQGHTPEYRDIHPPAGVYAWYARELASALEAWGLVGP